MRYLEESLRISVCPLREENAGFDSEEICDYQVPSPLEADEEAVVKVALDSCVLYLPNDEDDSEIVDD